MKTKAILLLTFLVATTVFGGTQKTTGETVNKTFQVSKGGNLEVSIGGGDIVISSWEKAEISVQAEGIDSGDMEELSMDQFGNNVEIEFFPEDSDWVKFTIQVPSEFNTDLQTSGGDIEIRGNFRGLLEGNTSGGDITFDDVDGNVEMSTSGGDIKAGKINGPATLRTSGGDIDVTSASGQVDVHTSGGDITVGSVGKSLEARTAGGDIIVGDVGGEAKVSTAGGDVRVGKVTGSATLDTAGGDIELRGGSGTVKAKTAGGDISLLDVSGSVMGSTAGGDVRAELRPSGSGRSGLKSSGGDILLYLPENAKATITAVIDINGRWAHHSEDYEISSDFKSETYEKDPERKEIRATYVLNGGGESISLDTINGSIQIRILK